MREVTINGEKTTIVGSAITPWIYESEFKGEDMVSDLSTFLSGSSVKPKLNSLAKMCWAMARNAKYPREFPDYVTWLEDIGGFDHSDDVLAEAVVFEAMKGCFPGKKAMVSDLERKRAEQRAGSPAEPERAGDGEAGGAVTD